MTRPHHSADEPDTTPRQNADYDDYQVVHGLESGSFAEALLAKQEEARRRETTRESPSATSGPTPSTHAAATPTAPTPTASGSSRTRRERARPRNRRRAAPSLSLRRLLARSASVTHEGDRGLLADLLRLVTFDLRDTARRRGAWLVLIGWTVHVYGLLVLSITVTGGDNGTLVHSLLANAVLLGGLVLAPVVGADTLTRLRASGLLDMLRLTGVSARRLSWALTASAVTKMWFLLALALPALVVGPVMGGTDVSGAFAQFPVMAVTFGASAAVATACASLVARRAWAVTTAATLVAALVLGPPLLYGALVPLTARTVPTDVLVLSDVPRAARATAPAATDPCTVVTEDRAHTRPRLVWWTLLPQPFVLLADAAPGRVGRLSGQLVFEPLSALRRSVRTARLPLPERPYADECPVATAPPEERTTPTGENAADPTDAPTVTHRTAQQIEAQRTAQANALLPYWPAGLALHVLTGMAAVGLTTRRLRTPGLAAWGEHPLFGSPQDE